MVNSTKQEAQLPQYQRRKMYKIDWKVCFMRWALTAAGGNISKVPYFHVYVEDDSFACTSNLIHQMALLRLFTQSPPQSYKASNSSDGLALPLPFRAGTPMWDGFDDSSTLMTREIVVAFAEVGRKDQRPNGPNINTVASYLSPCLTS
jgi:hypothetical protein